MSKNLKIIFTVSLLLNVVLAGFTAGIIIRDIRSHPWVEEREDFSPTSQHMMARMLQQTHHEIKPLITKARALRKEMVTVISAEEFDTERYETLSQKLNKVQQELAAHKAESMKALIEAMPLKDRQAFAKHFEKRPGGGRRARNRSGDND